MRTVHTSEISVEGSRKDNAGLRLDLERELKGHKTSEKLLIMLGTETEPNLEISRLLTLKLTSVILLIQSADPLCRIYMPPRKIYLRARFFKRFWCVQKFILKKISK